MDVVCPTCDGEAEPIKESAQSVTLKCVDCGHVWTTSPRAMRIKELQIIISDGEQSTRDMMVVVRDDLISMDDEFEHAGHRMIVTAIESEGRYVKKAKATDVAVLHAKIFDTVPLKLSVNEGEVTKSYRMDVEPEYEVHIGQVIRIGDLRLAVKTLKSDQNRTLHKGFLLARNVRRAFCDPVKKGRRGSKVPTRRRGAPPGAQRKKR